MATGLEFGFPAAFLKLSVEGGLSPAALLFLGSDLDPGDFTPTGVRVVVPGQTAC